MNYQAVLVWGGLRGSVSLALALSIPTELPYWFTIQCMAFGVVHVHHAGSSAYTTLLTKAYWHHSTLTSTIARRR